jgi:membrane-associated phospholipid phosphatase
MTYKHFAKQNGIQNGQDSATSDKSAKLAFIRTVQRYRCPILDIIARALSKFADEEFLLFLFPTFAWTIHSRLCIHLAMLVPLGYSVGNILKNLYCVERPKSPDIWRGRNVNEDDYGYPSTHSILAVIFPFYVIYYVSQGLNIRAQVLLWSLNVLFWFAVAWSRLYLGVHYLEDVIFGAIVGLILSFGYVLVIGPLETLLTSGNFFACMLITLPFLAQVVFHPLYYHWDKQRNKLFDKWTIHMSNSGYLVSARLLGIAWAVPFSLYFNPHLYHQTRPFYLEPARALLRFIIGLPILIAVYFISRALLTKSIILLYRLLNIPALDLQGNAGHSGATVKEQSTTENNHFHSNHAEIPNDDPSTDCSRIQSEAKKREKTWFNLCGYTSLQVKPPRIFLQYALMAFIIFVIAPYLFQKLQI